MMKPYFIVIIAGTRTFSDYDLLEKTMDKLLSQKKFSMIKVRCGLCRGADRLGEKYARKRQYEVEYFQADWKRYGKKAGPRRNEQMAIGADALVVFWDGKSKGTYSMIQYAKQYNLQIRIIKY